MFQGSEKEGDLGQHTQLIPGSLSPSQSSLHQIFPGLGGQGGEWEIALCQYKGSQLSQHLWVYDLEATGYSDATGDTENLDFRGRQITEKFTALPHRVAR